MTEKLLFWEARVEARSVEDFLDRYYKPERYGGHSEAAHAATLLRSHQEYFKEYGYAHISRHDSVTGHAVSFFSAEMIEAAVLEPYKLYLNARRTHPECLIFVKVEVDDKQKYRTFGTDSYLAAEQFGLEPVRIERYMTLDLIPEQIHTLIANHVSMWIVGGAHE